MNTQIYLENTELDVSADISALITFAIDDVADFSSRQTSWSKTIVLPGTARNNRALGHIYQIGQSNDYDDASPNIGYNFNASKSAACVIFQDNLQTFKGVMRLLQINMDKGRAEYEVSVFGEIASLNVQLSSRLLEDLDFSSYNEVYNNANIVASWSKAPGSGIYYPLIDFGNYSVEKHDWDIRTFRPALYVREYLDKIFTMAGYRYACSLFDTNRFKRLIIPHNQKKLTKIGQNLVTAANNIFLDEQYIYPGSPYHVGWQTFSGTDFTLASNSEDITYDGTAAIYVSLTFKIKGVYKAGADGSNGTFYISLVKNGLPFPIAALPAPDTDEYPFDIEYKVDSYPFSNGDVFQIQLDTTEGTTIIVDIDGSSLVFATQKGTAIVNVNPGDMIDLNYAIPKNIRQIDFLVSIVKLFNLYVYEDRFDDKLIRITPFVDFYAPASTNAVDWSYKLNRNGAISIKPMSELNAKIYKYNYKSDSDYYNDLYNKRYSQGYGSNIYDTQFEFTSSTKQLELIFAATPLVGYVDEDKVYSTICKVNNPDDPAKRTEETIDSVIRILQTKKITGVETWAIKDGATELAALTDYGYAGHLNDPDAPSNDLNFGALNELFFTLANGDLSKTQFNLYWSAYMAEITDKDSKLLTASFYLTPKDIYDLDFSKYVMVDGVLFRLNKISDYNMSQPGECKVELLKVIHTSYTEGTFSATRTENFACSICGEGYTGTSVAFSKTYTSTLSQADADSQAANDEDFTTQGQAYADDPANGATCAPSGSSIIVSNGYSKPLSIIVNPGNPVYTGTTNGFSSTTINQEGVYRIRMNFGKPDLTANYYLFDIETYNADDPATYESGTMNSDVPVDLSISFGKTLSVSPTQPLSPQ